MKLRISQIIFMGARWHLRCATLALAFAALPTMNAQTATVVGWPANFDAVNDTGQTTRGFEIEADGIQQSDVSRIFGGAPPTCVIRYCTGTIVPFQGGVYIRWVSPVDPSTGQFTQGTPRASAAYRLPVRAAGRPV